jgi:hypothetical protein
MVRHYRKSMHKDLQTLSEYFTSMLLGRTLPLECQYSFPDKNEKDTATQRDHTAQCVAIIRSGMDTMSTVRDEFE